MQGNNIKGLITLKNNVSVPAGLDGELTANMLTSQEHVSTSESQQQHRHLSLFSVLACLIPSGMLFSGLDIVFLNIVIGRDKKISEDYDRGGLNNNATQLTSYYSPLLFELYFGSIFDLKGQLESWLDIGDKFLRHSSPKLTTTRKTHAHIQSSLLLWTSCGKLQTKFRLNTFSCDVLKCTQYCYSLKHKNKLHKLVTLNCFVYVVPSIVMK